MKNTIQKTILLSKESYLFLLNKGFTERFSKEVPEVIKNKWLLNFDRLNYSGYMMLMNGAIIGKENGKIKEWTCNDMVKILKSAKLEYKFGKDIECMNL